MELCTQYTYFLNASGAVWYIVYGKIEDFPFEDNLIYKIVIQQYLRAPESKNVFLSRYLRLVNIPVEQYDNEIMDIMKTTEIMNDLEYKSEIWSPIR